ncbi:hypothetical protein A0U40_08035 [[Bacillus] sp. KCTC 13219]|nr:hypothetical protein A0U40_08035 [[Bacillus] sp. KCTC 13219]
MRKKINIAMLTMLLVFQTLIGPLSVFADEVIIPEQTPPVEENNGGGDVGEESQVTSEDTASLDVPQNIVGPLSDRVYQEDVDLDIIQSVTLNGQNVESMTELSVRNGDTAQFQFEFALQEGHPYGPGSKLTIPLDPIFNNIQGQGNVSGYGTFSVQGNAVEITFNDNILDEFGGPFAIEEAFFNITARFDANNTEWEKDIDIPGSETITLKFNPRAGQGTTVNKDVDTVDGNGQDSQWIDWVVTVNTNAQTTGPQIFEDELDPLLEYDQNHPVTITPITITPAGIGSEGTPQQVPVSDITYTATTMSFNLPDTTYTGYKIKYRTLVGDPGNVRDHAFRNTAKYNGETAQGSQHVNFGDPLAKSVTKQPSASDLTTAWQISYNYNKRTISEAVAKITDTWTDSQELVDGIAGIKVSPDESNYVINHIPGSNTFEIDFTGNIDKAYTITYETQPKANVYPVNNIPVINTVERPDMPGEEQSANVTYNKNSLLLNKAAVNNGINYEQKTMDWTITANQAGYELVADTVFTDTFTDNNLTLIEDTLIVNVGGTALTRGSGYTLTNNNKDGFTITLISATNERITISYTTEYDIKNDGQNDNQYRNSVHMTNNNLPPEGVTDSATHFPRAEQQANGKKSGHYDYAEKTFYWDVELNFNYNTLENAIFVDALPTTQTIQNIVVETGTVNAAGTFSRTGTLNVSNSATVPNEIRLELGEITGPVKVTYESVDTDDVIEHTGSRLSITNTAELYNGTIFNAGWETTVNVEKTEKILEKYATVTPNSQQIAWNFEFNYAQSELKDVVITDTVGKDADDNPNQIILEDTFKVYKVELTGETPASPTVNRTLLASDEYDLDIDVRNGTFTLTLGDVEDAYFVEYETIFIGASGTGAENTVTADYVGVDRTSGSDYVLSAAINYGAGATGIKVPFVIVKTDAATGEPLEGVTFNLRSQYGGNKVLVTGTTDEDGILDFGYMLAEGMYYLDETIVPDGYNQETFNFALNRANVATTGEYIGKQVVEIQNMPIVGGVCDYFELTVRDVDAQLVNGENITLTNKVTGFAQIVTINDGEIEFKRNASISGAQPVLIAGEYEVTYEDGYQADVTVEYSGSDCNAEVQPQPACPQFTITIFESADENGDGQNPRQNATITLIDEQGQTVIVKDTQGDTVLLETDENGQVKLPSTRDNEDGLKAGDYAVYEGNQFLGKITVSYKGNCETELIQSPSCPQFTVHVNDVDGNPVADGTQVVVKDANGSEIANVNTIDGKITIGGGENNPILSGLYTVEVDGETYTVETLNCEATVQPLVSGCSQFTLTVSNEDGLLPEGTIVTILKDGETATTDYTVGENGQVIFPVTDGVYSLEPGNYTVVSYTDAHGKVRTFDSVDGAFQVSYASDCADAVEKPRACTVFTIIVKKPDGSNEEQGTKVIVEDANGNPITSDPLEVGEDGKVEFPANQEPGYYTVYEVNEDGSKGSQIGTEPVKVTYADNCEAVELPRNACPQFTLTVKTADGTSVQAGVKVSIVDENGHVVVANRETNNDGQIIYERDGGSGPLKQDETYKIVNEAGKVLGTITVSYTDEVCGAEVQVPANACPLFTLTIQDVNGNSRENVAFTVKDKLGNTIVTGTTDVDGKATVPYTVEPGEYQVIVGTESPLTITVVECQALAKPTPPTPGGGGGGGGGGTPPTTPEEPTTPPTTPEEPTTPPTTPEEPTTPPTTPEEPTTPPTTPEEPTTPPGVEEVIKKIPQIPGIVPVPPTPGSEEPVRYEVPNIPQIVEELAKDPAKLQQTIQDLEAFIKQYESLSPEEQAYVDELVNMDLVRSLLNELKEAANVLAAANNNQNKLPQTNDANSTTAMVVGFGLLALGFVLLRRRFMTTEK